MAPVLRSSTRKRSAAQEAPQRAPKSRKTSAKSTANRISKPVFAFPNLPYDIALLVVDYLSAADTTHLAMTCKSFYVAFRGLGIEKDVRSGRAISAAWACASGTAEVLRLALQAGCSPMHRVDCRWFPGIISHYDTKFPLPLLCISSHDDRTAQLKELLSAGVRIHSKAVRKQIYGLASSFLELARHPNMIAFLLAIGFQKEINAELGLPRDGTTHRGSTAVVQYAVLRNEGEQVLAVLLDAGADPDKTYNSFDDTALALSLNRGDHDMAHMLISRGAMLNPTASSMPRLESPSPKGRVAETKRLLSMYVPLGLDVNHWCRVSGYSRLGAVLQDHYPAGMVQAYLDWGADPRQAFWTRNARDSEIKPPLTPLQYLFGGQRCYGYGDVLTEAVELRITKAKILLAAEGSSIPQPPPEYKSMLDWIVITVPLDTIEIAVRTLEPWMELMSSDNSTVLALERRLTSGQPTPPVSGPYWYMRDLPFKQKEWIMGRIAGYLRQFRAPGFVTHDRPRRHKTQMAPTEATKE